MNINIKDIAIAGAGFSSLVAAGYLGAQTVGAGSTATVGGVLLTGGIAVQINKLQEEKEKQKAVVRYFLDDE